MNQTLAFTVTFPREMLEDIAENVHGIESLEGVSAHGVLSMIHDVVSTGVREYLGDEDEVAVKGNGNGSFTIQIPSAAIADYALNEYNVDDQNALSAEDVSQIMCEMVEAGLDELLGYCEGVKVGPA